MHNCYIGFQADENISSTGGYFGAASRKINRVREAEIGQGIESNNFMDVP